MMWKRLSYLVPPFLPILLVKLAFRNTRHLRPEGKSGTRKTPSVKESQAREHLNVLNISKTVRPDGLLL